jgi:translation initiation factor IF-3
VQQNGFTTEVPLIAYGRGQDKKPAEPSHRVNDDIRAAKVRLIGADGNQVGIVSRDEALAKAEEAGLDLVEIAPQADPPVVKVMDYGKFRYEQQKKERDSRRKGHRTKIKKIRLSPKVDEHDFETKLKSIRSFIEQGDKVKVTLLFKGRMVTHKELGRDVMERVVEETSDIAKLEGDISMESHRNMVMTLVKK